MVYARLYYHLVWSTKNRESLITQKLESDLFPYLENKAKNLDCCIFAVNAFFDHIHLIMEIPPKCSIADIVKGLKGASSFDFSDLYWQRGYGVLSISERNLNVAIDYVKNQKDHHANNKTFIKYEKCDDEDMRNSSTIQEPKEIYYSNNNEPF
ncbi:MAG: IS200/IS605 family transposase [Anaerolineaceae bacterium]|nr:IS200/IS605 family transposase [Anaerolineaceae bacterium]